VKCFTFNHRFAWLNKSTNIKKFAKFFVILYFVLLYNIQRENAPRQSKHIKFRIDDGHKSPCEPRIYVYIQMELVVTMFSPLKLFFVIFCNFSTHFRHYDLHLTGHPS